MGGKEQIDYNSEEEGFVYTQQERNKSGFSIQTHPIQKTETLPGKKPLIDIFHNIGQEEEEEIKEDEMKENSRRHLLEETIGEKQVHIQKYQSSKIKSPAIEIHGQEDSKYLIEELPERKEPNQLNL